MKIFLSLNKEGKFTNKSLKSAYKQDNKAYKKALRKNTTYRKGVVNRYLDNHNVTINGRRVQLKAQNISDVVGKAKKVKDFLGYFM